ncbi:MAG: methylated-DNA--[protein]-cysteine S-methyltransferase [Saprospiraceae bacterium]|nr:methylated-DNA--[protein]-cysteine S-methyltransferase [Bacteroidia bacterium]NNE15034.1 methylated-DNA--[protein]-cysteine S-methyltransferase [Saprospiraceae bacterium]NNL91342.1 methylated-DNA--[protein]-cysteine S-methyltransferase [Saprospiraceae bacterium]
MQSPTYFDFISSPIGFWTVEANDSAITAIKYDKNKPHILINPSSITDRAKQQLIEYFDNERTTFDLPLNTSEYSSFYKAVWSAVEEIPYGKTSSYSQVAHHINNPKSVRAVGMANGKNPFPIIIPCHRVIGKDNSLTGYASGIKIKKWLLEHEGSIPVQKMLFE